MKLPEMIKAGALAACAMFALTTQSNAANIPAAPMPEASEEFVEAGRGIYIERCSFCHGLLGDGNGPAANYLDPRPRDFTLGTFKFRTTHSGELPTDNDLFRTVSRGLPGTAMQAFDDTLIKNGLSEEERWQVISYIKTFAYEFEDPDLDPVANGLVISLPDNPAPYTPETIARGADVFERAKCWSCHGMLGRGDGNAEFREDDWGFPIRIRNVTHPWKIKAGGEVEDIYMRFTSGISGTPMPSFVKSLDEADRWDLANYIKSLQHDLTSHQTLKAALVDGDLPENPADAMWDGAAPMDVRLTGQVIAAPRWQNPSIEMVTVQALFNKTDIAFRLTWDDPFKDVIHDEGQEFDPVELMQVGGFNSYVEANDMIPRALETFRDAIALQFAVKPPNGTAKPHFFRGSTSDQVHLLVWMADQVEAGARGTTEGNARGWKQAIKPQAEEGQNVTGGASWDQGRWSVVMKRPLVTEDKADVQFAPGIFIPMSLNAWDGSNGEHGRIMSLSSWYFVFLEAPTPSKVYIYTVLAFLVLGALGLWLTRKTINAKENEEAEA
ncbi:MAG: c-type cytochrome [Rhodobacteraceae bacterium]|nr:c-type cytochrome [Paracoccaceae bacterium]